MSVNLIEYQGKIGVRHSTLASTLFFTKINATFSYVKVVDKYVNISGNIVEKIKGYKTSGKFNVFATNNYETTQFGTINRDFENLRSLISVFNNLSETDIVSIDIYCQPELGNEVLATFTFDTVSANFDFSKYLSGNSKLGLEFEFALSNLTLITSGNLPSVW